MQIAMLLSELEAQEILGFCSVLGRDSAAVKGSAVLSEIVPYSFIQTFDLFYGLFFSPLTINSNSTLFFGFHSFHRFQIGNWNNILGSLTLPSGNCIGHFSSFFPPSSSSSLTPIPLPCIFPRCCPSVGPNIFKLWAWDCIMLTRSHDLSKLSALVHIYLVFITRWYQYAHSSSLAEELHLLFYFMFWKCRLDKLCSRKILCCSCFPSFQFASFEPS